MANYLNKLQYKHIVAIIYTVILFLDKLDLTVVNVTFPTVARYFHVSIVDTDWINMSFLLALAISIPISSWLGERFGLKKIYIIAIIIFGLSSTLCIGAPNLTSLYLLRFFQGIGGGLLIPVGMTMLYRTYEKSEYASITSFTFLPSLIAPAIAPFIGGILVQSFGWRFVFMFTGPICLLLAILAILILKESQSKQTNPLDWIGFLLGSLLLMSIFYSLSQISKPHHAYILVLALIFFVSLTYLFIQWENKQTFPLINLQFFKNKIFRMANLVQLCFQICHFGAIFIVGLYLQVGIGFSPSKAGLIMGMQAFGAMVTSRPSVRLFNSFGPRLPLMLGFIGIAILSPCIMLIQNSDMLIFGMLLFFIRGIFSGLCGTPIQTLSVIDFSSENLAQVNSIFNIGRQIGINLGIAISSIMISLGLAYVGLHNTNVIPPNLALTVFFLGFLIITIISCLGILFVQNLRNEQFNLAPSLIKYSRTLLKLELMEGKLVYQQNKINPQSVVNTSRNFKYSYYLKQSFIYSIPVFAMGVNFVNTAMPSWISMNSWISDYPFLDFPIGMTLLVCHTSYFILLFANDVLIGFNELRNLKQSPFSILFKFSKVIFTAPVIKIAIAATYRSTKSAYTFDEFVKNVMRIQNDTIRRGFRLTAAASSCLVLILGRSLASFKYYLEPIKVDQNQFDVNLLSNDSKTQATQSQNCYTKIKDNSFHIPVGLIRAFAIAFIIYGLFIKVFSDTNSSELGSQAIAILLSLFSGFIVFTQSYYSESSHKENVHARKILEYKKNQSPLINLPAQDQKSTQLVVHVISTGSNFGNQATEALLTVVAMISLLGSWVGNQNAAVLGLMVGIESGWVNFHYFKNKIYVRVSQLVDSGKRTSKTLLQNFSIFSTNPYQQLEDVDLKKIPDNPQEELWQSRVNK